MANDPWTGARLGNDRTDSPIGGTYLAEAVNELGTWTQPAFANAAARDAAYTAWQQNGNTPKAGMRCYTLNDKQVWLWNGTGWVWPPEPQGVLAFRTFTDTTNSASNYMTPLSNTNAGLPVFDVSMPLLPAGRHIQATFFPNLMADAGGCAYGFVITIAGLQARRMLHVPVASSVSSPIPNSTPLVWPFDTTVQSAPATGGITGGARFAGGGNCYMVTPGAGTDVGFHDGPAYLLVEDMGGV